MPPNGFFPDTFKVFLQELKKHYSLKNLALPQKAYLHNHVKKQDKPSIENTAAWLRKVNGMMVHFPTPGNNQMAEDELCNIIY
eukprot:10073048-Ditylum_brightwellii.AAC.1